MTAQNQTAIGLSVLPTRGYEGPGLTGWVLRLLQTGNLQAYALLFVPGVAMGLWIVRGK